MPKLLSALMSITIFCTIFTGINMRLRSTFSVKKRQRQFRLTSLNELRYKLEMEAGLGPSSSYFVHDLRPMVRYTPK